MTGPSRGVPGDDTRGGAQLKRVLGGGFAMATGIGTIVGMGVMRTPGEIVAIFHDPFTYVGLWLLVGLFVLMNIAVAAELLGMTPRSGGYYVLVRRAMGPFPGFLIGWVDWLAFPATIAIKTTVLAEYLALLAPALQGWETPVAVAVTSLFAVLQMRGVVLGARIQQVASAIMCLILVSMTIALLMAPPVAAMPPPAEALLQPGLKEYGLVLAAIVFTYDGWLAAAYFGGEIRGGGGAVARASIQGVLIILLLYVGLNAALAFSVPLEQLAGEELALSRALDIALGPGSGTFVLLAAVLILFSHQNTNYLAAPRTLYALSLDGFGIGRATRVHAGGNPLFAVMLTWLATVGLILLGGFEFLLNLNALFFVVLYVAVMCGVVLLRFKDPLAERPYRAWGHPFTTILCIAGWLVITGFMAYTAPKSAFSALAMTAISVPVYLVITRLRRGRPGLARAEAG